MMELAFLLRGVGIQVVWITNQKPAESDEVVYSLEQKMLEKGVKVAYEYDLMKLRVVVILVYFVLVNHGLDLTSVCFKVFSAKGQEAIDVALKSDLVILNTAAAGKWLDAVLKKDFSRVLPKVLWWIHEMRGHYFKLEYVKHLPFVVGAMIDSHTTVEYWNNLTQEHLR